MNGSTLREILTQLTQSLPEEERVDVQIWFKYPIFISEDKKTERFNTVLFLTSD